MGLIAITKSPRDRLMISRSHPNAVVGLFGITIVTPNVLRGEAEKANSFIEPLSLQWATVSQKWANEWKMFEAWHAAWKGLYTRVQEFGWLTLGAAEVYNQIQAYAKQANNWGELLKTLEPDKKFADIVPSTPGTGPGSDWLKWLFYIGAVVLAILVLPPIVRLIVRR